MKIKMRKQSCGGTDEDTYDVQKEEFNFLKKPCENEAKDANKKKALLSQVCFNQVNSVFSHCLAVFF